MLDINIDVLQECWAEQQKLLKDGLLSGDIWDTGTGLTLSGHNSAPEAVALFSRMTDELKDTLESSGFPELNDYYILNLEDDKMYVVIHHTSELLQGMLLNPKRVNMGILFTVAIPKAIAKVKSAIQ